MDEMKSSDAPSLRDVTEAPAEPKLSWWWSRDDERFHGPCSDRAEAIMEAWSDDADQGAWICRAAQREWRTDIFEPDVVADAFDDANEEVSDPDGDPPSALLSKDDWKAIAREAQLALRRALRRHGSMAWGFASQHPSEWVDIGAMYRAAEAASVLELVSTRKDGSSQPANPHA